MEIDNDQGCKNKEKNKMEQTIEDQLYRVIARLSQEPKGRETSLAITNAEQALLWWQKSQKLEREKQMGAGSNG